MRDIFCVVGHISICFREIVVELSRIYMIRDILIKQLEVSMYVHIPWIIQVAGYGQHHRTSSCPRNLRWRDIGYDSYW